MAWLKTLAETYDTYADLAGVDKNDQAVLLPISHSTFNAQIEVMINLSGNFQDAKKLDKGKDTITIIPVTIDSGTKTSGTSPHPLCDKLCYVAGDYTKYTGDNKEKYYRAYMSLLEDWAESEYSHPMVQAVHRYLSKKSLIQDLVVSKVLELDEDGRLTDHSKIQERGQTDANVRFRILGGSMPQEVWKNQELYKKYSEYYQQKLKLGKQALCYASGKIEPYCNKHPFKIRHSGDRAKLISGNDNSGFTYLGRFTSKEQAVTVGYYTSQKAHNALRWLIQKQGYTRDGSAIVCWMANRNMQVPDMMKDSINAYRDIDEFDFDFDSFDVYKTSGIIKHDTGKYLAEQFNNAVNGYAGKIKIDDKVAVIALDAAKKDQGRLSIVYYDEMGGRQYMGAILNWQQHCKWHRSIKVGRTENDKKNKKAVTCECAPSPRDIILAAFGVQKSKKSEKLEADEKLIRVMIKQLLPCITRKGMQIPPEMIKAAAQRASMPQTMSDFVWYNDVLCVVCAMTRFNYEREEKTMDNFLNDNLNDRNVLFGRLLAVYDYMEQRAMFDYEDTGKAKDRRTTNAKRYWNAYSSRPARTTKTIRENLLPYERRLSAYELKKFEDWSGEIMAHLAENQFDNTALSEMYLPGYYLQMEYMKKSFQKKEAQKEEDQASEK